MVFDLKFIFSVKTSKVHNQLFNFDIVLVGSTKLSYEVFDKCFLLDNNKILHSKLSSAKQLSGQTQEHMFVWTCETPVAS